MALVDGLCQCQAFHLLRFPHRTPSGLWQIQSICMYKLDSIEQKTFEIVISTLILVRIYIIRYSMHEPMNLFMGWRREATLSGCLMHILSESFWRHSLAIQRLMTWSHRSLTIVTQWYEQSTLLSHFKTNSKSTTYLLSVSECTYMHVDSDILFEKLEVQIVNILVISRGQMKNKRQIFFCKNHSRMTSLDEVLSTSPESNCVVNYAAKNLQTCIFISMKRNLFATEDVPLIEYHFFYYRSRAIWLFKLAMIQTCIVLNKPTKTLICKQLNKFILWQSF